MTKCQDQFDLSPPSMVEEAGAAYPAVRVDFAKSEQRQPEYLAINPKGRVRRVSAMRACAYARARDLILRSGCPPLSLLIEKHGRGVAGGSPAPSAAAGRR
jgi:hypothetical protein